MSLISKFVEYFQPAVDKYFKTIFDQYRDVKFVMLFIESFPMANERYIYIWRKSSVDGIIITQHNKSGVLTTVSELTISLDVFDSTVERVDSIVKNKSFKDTSINCIKDGSNYLLIYGKKVDPVKIHFQNPENQSLQRLLSDILKNVPKSQ